MALGPVKVNRPVDDAAARRQAQLLSRGARNNPEVFGNAGTENAKLLDRGLNPTVEHIRNSYIAGGVTIPAEVEADLVALQQATEARSEVQRVPSKIRRAGRLAGNRYFDLYDLEQRENDITQRLAASTRGVVSEPARLQRTRERAATDSAVTNASRARMALALDEATFDSKVSTQLAQERGTIALADTRESVSRVQAAGESEQITQEQTRTKRGLVGLQTDRLQQQGTADANRIRNEQGAASAAQAAASLKGTNLLNDARADSAAITAIKLEAEQNEAARQARLDQTAASMEGVSNRELQLGMMSGRYTNDQMEVAAERLGYVSEVDDALKAQADRRKAVSAADKAGLDADVTKAREAIVNYGSIDAIPEEELVTLNQSPMVLQMAADQIAESQNTRQQREITAMELVARSVQLKGDQRTSMLNDAARVLVGADITDQAAHDAFVARIPAGGIPIPIPQPDGTTLEVNMPAALLQQAAAESRDGFQLRVQQSEEKAANIALRDQQLDYVESRFDTYAGNGGVPIGPAAATALASAKAKAQQGTMGPTDVQLVEDALIEQIVGKAIADDMKYNKGRSPDKQRPVPRPSPSQSYQLQLVHNRLKPDDAVLRMGFTEYAAGEDAKEVVTDPIVNRAFDAVIGEEGGRDQTTLFSYPRDILDDTSLTAAERGEALYRDLFNVGEDGLADPAAARKVFTAVRQAVEPEIRNQQFTYMSGNLKRSLTTLPIDEELAGKVDEFFINNVKEADSMGQMPALLGALALIEDEARKRDPDLPPTLFSDWLSDSAEGSQQLVATGMSFFKGPRSHAGLAMTAGAFGIDPTSVPLDTLPQEIARVSNTHLNSMLHSYRAGKHSQEVDHLRLRGARRYAESQGLVPQGSIRETGITPFDATPYIEAGFVNTLELQLSILENN